MRTAARTYARTYDRSATHRMALSVFLLGATVIMAFFYAANLYTLISRTVAIQKTETKIASVTGAMAKLDSEYLRRAKDITPDSLARHGLVEGEVSLYITKPAQTAAVVARANHEL